MTALKLSIATAPFGLPLRAAIDQLIGSGADGVQFELREEVRVSELGETGRRQLLHYLQERNLKVGPATFNLRRALADPVGINERIYALQEALDAAWKLGARQLTFRLGELPSADDAAGQDLLLQLLRDLAAQANRVGVVPVLIPGGEPAERLQELLTTIKEGPLGLELDPAALHLSRRDVGQWLRILHPFVQHLQIRDVVRDVSGFGKEVPHGRGEVDWDELAALLQEVDYRGWLTVIRNGGQDPLGEALQGLKFVRNVLIFG